MTKRIIVVMMVVGLCAPMAMAGITATGSVYPADPATWTSSTEATIGRDDAGSVTVDNGSDLLSSWGKIGYSVGSRGTTGVVTVDGTGSTWTSSAVTVGGGSYGDGTLNIINGGAVDVRFNTSVGPGNGTTGVINFDNGTLTTGGLLAGLADLRGTGTINTNGLVSDVALVFDATHGLAQTLAFTGPGQDLTVNIEVRGTGSLGAGYVGNGSLTIADGLLVVSMHGYIGYKPGSTGVASVAGTGTMWANNGAMYVGNHGDGTLNITDGAVVRNGIGTVAYERGSTGVVTVDGVGSAWNSSNLTVGDKGDGTLTVTNGASISSTAVATLGGRYGVGVVTIDGPGSTWTGTVRLRVVGGDRGLLNITDGGVVDVVGNSEVGALNFDNGTLTTGGYLGSMSNVTGTGTINTGGLVSDVALVFDATHGLTQTLSIIGPGQNITINLAVDGSAPMGVGSEHSGSMLITDGVTVTSTSGHIVNGVVTVDGAGSTWDTGAPSMWWDTGRLSVGAHREGTLNITNGGTVNSRGGWIGGYLGTGVATVDGAGSLWHNTGILYVGSLGSGTLAIANGGLVSVADKLVIDSDTDGDSFVNMATGGMLALNGEADDSLAEFLGLIGGTDAIRYWDLGISDWADLGGATYGDDYTLAYLAGGDLMGYTVLTVTAVPEPATMSLLALGGLAALRRRRRTGW